MGDESKPWVDGLTFNDVLTHAETEFGGNDAVVFPQLGLRWTYAEFVERVRETARALVALGIKQGDHVGIWSTNWPEWILAQFSTGLIGAVLVNVNPAYRKHELAYILNQADLQLLLITDTHKTSDYREMVTEVVPELADTTFGTPVSSDAYPKLQHVICIKDEVSQPGIGTWSAFIACAKETDEAIIRDMAKATRPADPVNIQYTSGTTGAPKGAMLSHRNLLMNAYYVGQRQQITEQDRLCIPVPFYHCFGCVMATLMRTIYGATMVLPAASFEPEPPLSAVGAASCRGGSC